MRFPTLKLSVLSIAWMAVSTHHTTVVAWSTTGAFIARCPPHRLSHSFLSSRQNQHATSPPSHVWLRASESPASEQSSTASALSDEEIQFLLSSFSEATRQDPEALGEALQELLPRMHPSLVVKLKTAFNDPNPHVQAVSTALGAIMEQQLDMAKATLKILLEAGEIRKLDAMIGKAAREGKLDAAFFTVLNMNLQDAQEEEPAGSAFAGGDGEAPPAANRAQILQHVYTRCQEEVEKTVPPGIALLNKLLRTEVDSIRANQLKHYLCPQPNTVTSPDGKVIELSNGDPRVLVPPSQLVDAIAQAIKQIRTVERAGGTDRVAAAGMVESVRTVAKEARLIIGQEYGVDSETLQEFEEGLQPVFRPDSPDSPYIQGV